MCALHHLPVSSCGCTQVERGAAPQTVATGSRVMAPAKSHMRIPGLSKGTNRHWHHRYHATPYTRRWWASVARGITHGQYGEPEAREGGVLAHNTKTSFGGALQNDGVQKGGTDTARIPPVSRMQRELGIEPRWKGYGTAALIYPQATRLSWPRTRARRSPSGSTDGRSESCWLSVT